MDGSFAPGFNFPETICFSSQDFTFDNGVFFVFSFGMNELISSKVIYLTLIIAYSLENVKRGIVAHDVFFRFCAVCKTVRSHPAGSSF